MKTLYRIFADTKNENHSILMAKQNDAKTRYLDITITDNGIPVDITGCEVRIYGRKFDGTEFYNNGEIKNATNGRCMFEATSQMLAVAAHKVKCEVIIFKDHKQILSTMPFDIFVVESLFSENAIESSNEYGALVVLYQNLYQAIDLMTDMVSAFGSKGAVANARNITTFWQGVEYLAKYMDTDLKGKIEEALANASVQGVLDLIGKSGDSGSSTVMGKLNNPRVVRRVQRGTFLTSKTGEDVTVSLTYGVTPSKCAVNLQGAGYYSFSSSSQMDVGVIVKELTSRTLTVGMSFSSTPSSSNQYSISWEVVEYY